MLEIETVDAVSTIRLLESIEALVLIHVFLDNARYLHAKMLREWLTRPGRRIKLLMSLPNDPPAILPAREPVE